MTPACFSLTAERRDGADQLLDHYAPNHEGAMGGVITRRISLKQSAPGHQIRA